MKRPFDEEGLQFFILIRPSPIFFSPIPILFPFLEATDVRSRFFNFRLSLFGLHNFPFPIFSGQNTHFEFCHNVPYNPDSVQNNPVSGLETVELV